MTKITKSLFKKACTDFLNRQKVIVQHEDKLKSMKRNQKENIDLIKKYMEENDHKDLEVGGYQFKREEVERCSITQKNLEEFLEAEMDKYRATYTKSVEKFKMKRPKRKKV